MTSAAALDLTVAIWERIDSKPKNRTVLKSKDFKEAAVFKTAVRERLALQEKKADLSDNDSDIYAAFFHPDVRQYNSISSIWSSTFTSPIPQYSKLTFWKSSSEYGVQMWENDKVILTTNTGTRMYILQSDNKPLLQDLLTKYSPVRTSENEDGTIYKSIRGPLYDHPSKGVSLTQLKRASIRSGVDSMAHVALASTDLRRIVLEEAREYHRNYHEEITYLVQ